MTTDSGGRVDHGQCVPVGHAGDRRLLPPPILGFTDVGEHQALVMAPRTQDAVVGVIAVARKAEQAFNIDDPDLMSDFANHAAVALTLASAREHARALTPVADRERIAHDLHDHVI